MRTRIREDNVYLFDELSESAKDRAREWFRIGVSNDFASFSADNVLEDAARLAQLFGLNIRQKSVRTMSGSSRFEPDVYWSVGDRGAGASYCGSYEFNIAGVDMLTAEAPSMYDGKEQPSNREINDIAVGLADVQSRYSNHIVAAIRHGRSRDFSITVDAELDVQTDEDEALSDEDYETLRQLFEDFAYWVHKQLEREWEYQMSDECVDENIRANDYEFTEDGERA